MTKKLILLSALFVINFSNAQKKEKGVFEITPKIGTSSFAEVTKEGNTDATRGVTIAITFDYYFNNRWSLRTGFSVDKMGSKSKILNNTVEDKLTYLSIPVNANWHFGSNRKWNLNFGLSPSILRSAKFISSNNQSDIPKEVIKSYQIGLSYGIGYKIEVTKKFGILLDAQLFSGLTNISKLPELDIRNAGGGYNIGAVIEL